MSGNIFVDCIFLFLICYAVISIFYDVSNFLLRRYCQYPQKSFITLSVNHGSNKLDCDIRCALSKSLKLRCALVVVCEGLDSDEEKIVWRLTDCYNHVIVCSPDELPQKLESASSISASQ